MEHRARILIGDEENPKTSEDPGPYRVAQYAVVGKEGTTNYLKHDLSILKSEQIREFTLNLGCTKVGSKSKYLVRKEIALRIELGVVHDHVNGPSV